MKLLDELLVQMREEDPTPAPISPESPKPAPTKRRGPRTIRPDRPLTNTEKQARHKLKKKLLEGAFLPSGKGRTGGLERISEIVVREGRKGLQPTIDPETGEVKAPRLQVTVRDALLAEKLIDSREGKIDDRRAMIAIAAALTGRGLPPPPEVLALEDGNTVEGDFEELRDD